MGTIYHRFLNEMQISNASKYLIFGTFNPGIFFENNIPNFYFLDNAPLINNFYFRNRNHFWALLPNVFGAKSLKGNNNGVTNTNGDLIFKQRQFCNYNSIVISDIIHNVTEISLNTVKTYKDSDLEEGQINFDSFPNQNRNILKIKDCQPEAVLSTFTNNTNTIQINAELNRIKNYCIQNKIHFANLPSPSGTNIQFTAGGVQTVLKSWRNIFYNLPGW